MRSTLTTTEAAKLAGVNLRSFARWARRRGIEPLRRMRIGESFVTVWLESDVLSAGCLTKPAPACSNSHDRPSL